ncbi:hypothetical protein DPEC_G00199050, partial [Dallia pectoralis]
MSVTQAASFVQQASTCSWPRLAEWGREEKMNTCFSVSCGSEPSSLSLSSSLQSLSESCMGNGVRSVIGPELRSDGGSDLDGIKQSLSSSSGLVDNNLSENNNNSRQISHFSPRSIPFLLVLLCEQEIISIKSGQVNSLQLFYMRIMC